MAMPAQVRRHWTAADVRELIREDRASPRYELIHGELLVTPSASAPHQMAVSELLVRLRGYCDAMDLGQALASPADIELEPESIVQPDVFVVPNSMLPRDAEMAWPDVHGLLLAIEIISPSSVHTDRVEKREFYLTHNVAEYWVVDLDARIVEVWRPDRATPTVARQVLEWLPAGASAPFRIELPAFFDSIRSRLRRA